MYNTKKERKKNFLKKASIYLCFQLLSRENYISFLSAGKYIGLLVLSAGAEYPVNPTHDNGTKEQQDKTRQEAELLEKGQKKKKKKERTGEERTEMGKQSKRRSRCGGMFIFVHSSIRSLISSFIYSSVRKKTLYWRNDENDLLPLWVFLGKWRGGTWGFFFFGTCPGK